MSEQIIFGERFIREYDESYGRFEDLTYDYLENPIAIDLDLDVAEYEDGSHDYYYSDTGELAFIIK